MRPATITIANDGAPTELVRRCGRVNERLILRVAENGSIRERDRIFGRACIHGSNYVHVLLELLAGTAGLDARLQSARIRVERSGDIGDTAVEDFRVGVGLNRHLISDAHITNRSRRARRCTRETGARRPEPVLSPIGP